MRRILGEFGPDKACPRKEEITSAQAQKQEESRNGIKPTAKVHMACESIDGRSLMRPQLKIDSRRIRDAAQRGLLA